MTAVEEWRPIPGYIGLYEVSSAGRIKALPKIDAQGGNRRERMFHPSRMDAGGHLGVKLRKDGIVKSRYVHHLVLEAFVGPRPEGAVACHWNDVPDDNRLINLRWGYPSDNSYDRVRNGGDVNASKTHCWRGHAFSADNTRVYAGRRHCRTCQRIYCAAYKQRRSEANRKAA